jgi:DNA (cytosine-5)-methyltransferase 1
MLRPSLFGLQNTNRDFTQRDSWGKNQFKTIDLFSGCGGLSLGFELAGFELVAAFEHWQPAIDIYRKNFKHPVYKKDLSDGDYAIFKQIQPEVLIGGPPCQDFSSAGKRNEAFQANLTATFAEIVVEVRPAIFVMENVDRIATSKTLAKILPQLQAIGYGLTQQVLNANLCGVPQQRKRFFLIGILGGADHALMPYLNANLSTQPLTVADYLGKRIATQYYYRHPRSYARRGVFSVDEPSPTIRGVNRPIPPN